MKKKAFFCLLATLTSTHILIGEVSQAPLSTPEQPPQDAQQSTQQEPNEPHSDFDAQGFITFKEYGKNLYENPRGIGCNHCHGDKGEGSIIARYKHKGTAKTLSAPAINTLEFNAFAKALDSQKLGVMPRYYLTPKEIQAIYFYLYE